MPVIEESALISGVYTVVLEAHTDERGRFMETFRKQWFPQRSWNIVQMNRSDSKAGVLRGLHYHFHQVDYWYVVKGAIRAGLLDIRPDSPTYRASQIVPMGDENQVGLFIPVGVAHGFAALTDVTLTYVVDNYYDSSDEYGVAWNDPVAALAWGVETPLISERDRTNRNLDDIDPNRLPPYALEKV
ncbi:MAG: dTDP-4-dehydrorhamnose 3,5-epimerase [Candidatus Promineifilaceae bacterium]|nr:dTDP-4-dehydrorhamnose 3,5-epimerase [Candidatus Promineifilaceae bacterium]